MDKYAAAIRKLKIEVEVADQAYADGGEFGVDLSFDTPEEVAQCEAAIAVLEQAERWAGLIEAAGRIDKDEREFFLSIFTSKDYYGGRGDSIVALVKAALPEPPEGGRG